MFWGQKIWSESTDPCEIEDDFRAGMNLSVCVSWRYKPEGRLPHLAPTKFAVVSNYTHSEGEG